MRKRQSNSRPNGRLCRRQGCKNQLVGAEQVCQACHAKELLCQYPGCGEPHGGQPITTKYCPPHRSMQRRGKRKNGHPGWTPEDDVLIRSIRANYDAREAGKRLRAAFPKHPSWAINRHVSDLGAATQRTKEPRWSPEEDALLKACAFMTPERIYVKFREQGYARTRTAIGIRMKRQDVRKNIDSITMQGLARMFGIDVHGVMRWHEKGWLKAERTGTTGDNHDRYHITTASIRDFILAHAEEFELSKLERVGSKMWFLSLITAGAIAEEEEPLAAPVPVPALTGAARTFNLCGEQVPLSALVEISRRAASVLLHRIDGLGMSVDAATFGEDVAGAGAAGAPVTAPAELGISIGQQLLGLMKKHKVKAPDIVLWTGFPAALVESVLAGTAPVLVGPALLSIVEKLDAEVSVSLSPRPHSYDA